MHRATEPSLPRPLRLCIAKAGRALAAVLALAFAAPTSAQTDGSAEIQGTSDFVTRDARIEFDRQSAQYARFDLEDLEPGDHGRAAALVALGASGQASGRSALVTEAVGAVVIEERIAAILGLGELGAKVSSSLDVLLEASRSDEPRIAGAALVALVRCGLPDGRERVDQVRRSTSDLAPVAGKVLAHHIDPVRSTPPDPYVNLYSLRWHAGRSYGTVDGKVWGATLLKELTNDLVFLDGLVMRLTVELELRGAEDHMLEILLNGEGAQRVIAATRLMPLEVEALVESGVWRPADDKEWKWLVLTILHEELSAFFPNTLARSIDRPVARWIAAGLLHRDESQYEDILIDGFKHEDSRNRAYAAYAVGAAGLGDYIPRLRELTQDEDTWAAANAIGALIRMGSNKGAQLAIDVLATPYAERPPFLTSYLFEVLEREAPDPDVMKFVEEVSPRLKGVDRASADAILLLHGVRVDSEVLRRELPLMNPVFPEAIRGARGLGRIPNTKDLELLARLFPREQAPNMNLELATALARAGHRDPEPLLEAALWKLPWNQSVLAAGCIHATYGERTLLTWVANPPAGVTDEDVRRVGYAIGEWGGLGAVERLRARLQTTAGAELPALQGAVLGALATRTR